MGAAANYLDLQVPDVFGWNYYAQSRYVINQGGTYSGKTYSILQVICFKAMERPGTVITVTAETLPALRTGAIRQFAQIAEYQPFKSWIEGVNKSTNTYLFTNGSTVEFKAFASEKAAHHGKRDYLFLNEANNIPYDIARQLIMRTTRQVFIDFNPTSDFWAHDHYLADDSAGWIYSTYRDNPFVPAEIVSEIESLKDTSPEHYKVYGLGKRGSLSGQVFGNIQWVNEFPQYATERRYGMDFGFTNSYTAICEIALADGRIYGRELMYTRGLTEPEVLQKMQELNLARNIRIVADSANPMLIAYLKQLHNINGVMMGGYPVVPCKKKNVREEVEAMKRYQWNITDESVNWKKEAKNYIYRKDRDGGLDNEPVKQFDHLWDAARYAFLDLVGGEKLPQFL
jgi:phage terminase large subunit